LQLLVTVGLTFVVIGVTNLVFGPTVKTIPLPQAISGPVDIGVRTFPAHRLFVIGCGLMVVLALWLFIERSAFGVKLRAAVDNGAMTAALGVRTDRVYAVTFALAVGLGAFGGVVGAEILPIEPYYAMRYMVTFLVVVSVGGAGSIAGALAASLALGFVDTLGKYLIPSLGEFFFYLAVILIALASGRVVPSRVH
jgi:branched-chain amino acid transport system permease protein